MSRRFKGRHAKVVADPAAEPVEPAPLDDSNSFVDPLQPDRRIPDDLNTRDYREAESTIAAREEKRAAAASAAAALKAAQEAEAAAAAAALASGSSA